jgi:cyclic pyranopterin monophosphate synthase
MSSADKSLSHINAAGEAAMVDVSTKAAVARRAKAAGQIAMSAEAFAKVRDAQLPKGDVLGTARIAGVMAAKQTSALIPLCHPLVLTDVQVRFTLDAALPGVQCEAEVRTVGQTGVEMEALTAVSVALLTIYDMAKAVDQGMVIGAVRLVEKVKAER